MNTLKHEELYRTPGLLKKMSELQITMCGAGAIGSNLVDNLIRQGFKAIKVIDYDRVEDHNKHTQIWNSRDIGQLKVNALKNYVFNVMGVSIETISKKLEESNIKKTLISPMGVIIDGFDNVSSRRLVTEHCKKNSLECLHVGLSKDYAEIIWNSSYRVPDDTDKTDVCEYPLARNIILLATTVATEILITYLEEKRKENCVITLKDLKIEKI